MTSMQTELTQQYSALNAALIQYPMLMQEVSTQLGSLPGGSSSNSSS
jgi:hypothetical protein